MRQGPTAGKPLNEAEIYEPPYLFDGEARAPRPAIVGGPATASWSDDVGVPVSEAAGRPASRAELVAPGAVTHCVDMNQRHVELSVIGRVPGKGLNVRMPASPNVAPPGWYMLFVLDAAGTPSVARGGSCARALRTPRHSQRTGRRRLAAQLQPPAAPAVDTRAPRATVKARRLGRIAREVRLIVRADEPAHVTVSVRIGRRLVRARLRITAVRSPRTLKRACAPPSGGALRARAC